MIRSDIPFADKVIELKKLFRKAEKLGACVEWKNWQDTLFKEAANAPDSAREAEVNKPNNQRTSTD